jgi:hypothetical protein
MSEKMDTECVGLSKRETATWLHPQYADPAHCRSQGRFKLDRLELVEWPAARFEACAQLYSKCPHLFSDMLEPLSTRLKVSLPFHLTASRCDNLRS